MHPQPTKVTSAVGVVNQVESAWVMECGKVECGAHLIFGNAKSDIGDRRHPILGMVNGQIGDTNQIGDKVVCCSQYFVLPQLAYVHPGC